MSSTERAEGSRNRIWAAAAVFVLLLAIYARWDAYYDLNDDSLMENILSGAYSGAPMARNIQSYFPLTALIAGFYRIAPGVPWYALLLIGLQALCVFLIFCRILKWTRAGATIAAAMIWCYAAYHFVFVQYSVTTGMLAVTAAFLFLTNDRHESPVSAIRQSWISLLLIFIGFLLRSEMMLMMLPFVALAVIYRELSDAEEKHRLSHETAGPGAARKGTLPAVKNIAVIGCAILLLLGIGWLGNEAGYHSAEWKEFYEFFDARTQLYDFAYIPDYAGNEAFYDELQLSPEEVLLLQNYNFGLDEELTAEKISAVADYAKNLRQLEKGTKQRVKEALWEYRASFTDEAVRDYQVLILLLYLLNAAVVLCHFRNSFVHAGTLLCLFAIRSALWLYLLYVHRAPIRLTHPMCMMEIMMLVVLLLREHRLLSEKSDGRREQDNRRNISFALILAAAAVFLVIAVRPARQIDPEISRREEVNPRYEAYLSYCAEHPDQVYFIDVYSTVSFTQGMFPGSRAAGPANQDLLGGWACKSPLYVQKLRRSGLTDVREGLLQENVFFVSRSDFETGWLSRYYESVGIPASIQAVDTIADYFTVYAVREENR